MIEDIAALLGRIRGRVSRVTSAYRSRRAVGVVVVLLLVGLSGYTAAGGATVSFTLGGPGDVDGPGVADGPGAASASATPGATGPANDDLPTGVLDGDERVGPSSRDVDGDGVTNAAEREIYGTDPAVADTDGDGVTDGQELACTDVYPDADPLVQDVYVELDSVEGTRLSEATVDRLRESFATAPVENPGNRSGIALHVVRSDTGLPENGSVNDDPRPGAYNDVADYRSAHFQRQDAGYYYLLLSTNVAYKGDDYYAGAGEPGTAIVEAYDREDVMTSLALHELGHAFGIDAGEDGVDERAYSGEAYHSVMNYNVLYETATYSDGTDEVGRDEWAFVANDRHQPTVRTERGSLCPTVD